MQIFHHFILDLNSNKHLFAKSKILKAGVWYREKLILHACHKNSPFCLRTDFYGSVKIVALQLSKEDLLQSTFPVFMTGNCYIQIVLELFLSREDFLKCSNCIARLGITCLEWYPPKTRLSLQDNLTSDCLQKL